MKVTLLLIVCALRILAQWESTGGPTYKYDVDIDTLVASGSNVFFPLSGWAIGVCRSIDFGESWTESDSGLTDRYINTIAAKGDTLFAFGDDGIFCSSDSGFTWECVSTKFSSSRIFICGNSMFAEDGADYNELYRSLYRSTDNGINWTYTAHVFDVHTIPNVMVSHESNLFAGNNSGVIRSTDSSESWTTCEEIADEVFAMAVLGDVIFAAGFRTGLYTSMNEGENWSSVDSLFLGVTSFSVSEDTVFAATHNSVSLSIDSGSHWTQLDLGFQNRNMQAISLKEGIIFAEVDENVYMTKNRGTDWTEVSVNLPYTNVSYIATNGNTVFAGTTRDGLHRSTDNGENWTVVDAGRYEGDEYYSSTDIFIHENIAFATFYPTLYRSTDSGVTWTFAREMYPESEEPDYPMFQAFTVIGNTIYAKVNRNSTYDYGVWKSTDNGMSWVSSECFGLPDTFITTLTANENTLFAGTLDGLFCSSDNGSNWSVVNTGVSERTIRLLAADGKTIAIGCGESMVSDPDKLCVSVDNGATWNEVEGISGGIRSIVIQDDLIFVAIRNDGVFQITHNGNEWNVVNTGMVQTESDYMWYPCLAINENYLFSSVRDDRRGYGVWRRPLSDFPIGVKTHKYKVPVQNDVTIAATSGSKFKATISFALPQREHVLITAYDLSGCVIQSIAGRYFTSGLHTLVWDTKSLPAGSYLVKMTTSTNTSASVFTVVR
jgi:photosystem II stability/assembly factor-like uncharacterized protein